LRQKLQCGLSHRQVAQSVGVGAGSVGDVMSRAKLAQLDWAKVQTLSGKRPASPSWMGIGARA
ncbi:MAG TPA: hypothetical protein VHW01_23820, partial [Polyangiaceae bacterium]|nr:hypothetical protein [Polyangiaceae bacterium]